MLKHHSVRNRLFKVTTLVLTCSLVLLTGCGSKTYKAGKQLDIGVLPNLPLYSDCGMAQEYAVVGKNEEVNAANYSGFYAAMLLDNTTREPVIAHNAHKKIYPASMTKIMTGLLVIESIEKGEISLDDMVTLNRKVTFDDWDAMASDLVGGCRINVKNLLYGLMITSYNDCGVILAELIAGSESAFCDMMNEKAQEIGATNTHFENCHGLHSDDHYTTAYDLYLIFNAAVQNDHFVKLISTKKYDASYMDASGAPVNVTWFNTNGYLKGTFSMPENVTVIGGKTGTTEAAGNCLVLYSKNSSGKPYISVVLKGNSKRELYTLMTELLTNFSKE